MRTPRDVFIDYEKGRVGTPYRDAPGRCLPDSPFHDCSGLPSAAMVVAKAVAPGFCLDTDGWAAFLHAHPECIAPLPVVRVTPGMVAIRKKGHPAFHRNGHMVTSLGLINGVARTVEAYDTARGVIMGYFDGNRGFEIGGRPPGVDGFGQSAGPQTIGEGVNVGWKIYDHPKATTEHPGYWCVDDLGHVYAYGIADYHGGQGFKLPSGKIVDLNGRCDSFTPSPSGNGYLMISSVGSIYAFGDATRLGDPHGDPAT